MAEEEKANVVLRAIQWRVNLGAFVSKATGDQSNTAAYKKISLEAVRQQRFDYEELRSDLDQSVKEVESIAATEEESKSLIGRVNKEVRKDVLRTFADVPYFQQETTRAMMQRVLLLWSVQNEQISYRQGMNDLCALIIIALRRDYDTVRDNPERYPPSGKFAQLVTADYLEHDTFVLFTHVMKVVAQWYSAAADESSPLGRKFHRIHHELLAVADPELYQHLQQLDVLPQLYLMQWTRLLFCREFSEEQTFILWDALFASPDLSFVDYVCVAMVEYVRNELISSDSCVVLTTLMRFPSPPRVQPIIDIARQLQQRGRVDDLGKLPQKRVQIRLSRESITAGQLEKRKISLRKANTSMTLTRNFGGSGSVSVGGGSGGGGGGGGADKRQSHAFGAAITTTLSHTAMKAKDKISGWLHGIKETSASSASSSSSSATSSAPGGKDKSSKS